MISSSTTSLNLVTVSVACHREGRPFSESLTRNSSQPPNSTCIVFGVSRTGASGRASSATDVDTRGGPHIVHETHIPYSCHILQYQSDTLALRGRIGRRRIENHPLDHPGHARNARARPKRPQQKLPIPLPVQHQFFVSLTAAFHSS